MIEFKVEKKSFTLIEIMLVIAIIAIIAALTVSNIKRQRINANEATAISILKIIHTALETYKDIYSAFPESLTVLTTGGSPGASPFLPSILATTSGYANHQGYNFFYQKDPPDYYCGAQPSTPFDTGIRQFYVNGSGVIQAQAPGSNWTPLE